MKKFKIALFKSLYCQQPSTTEIKESAHTHAHNITPCCVYSSKHKHRSLFTHSYKMQHNPDIFSSHSYKNGISAFQIPQLNDGYNISVIKKIKYFKSDRENNSATGCIVFQEARKVLRGIFIIYYFLKLAHNSHEICALNILLYSLNLVIFTLDFLNHSLKFLPVTIIIIIFIP